MCYRARNHVEILIDVQMKPIRVIEKKVTIENTDINTVYQKSYRWLNSRLEAEIIEHDEPVFIKAFHSIPSQDYYDMAKLISISLKQEQSDVLVEVIFEEPEKNPYLNGYENRRRVWTTMLEQMLNYIGFEIGKSFLQDNFSETDIRNNIREYLGKGLVIFIVMLLISSGFLYLANDPFEYKIVIGFIIIFQFPIIGYFIFEVMKWRKRLRELYPS